MTTMFQLRWSLALMLTAAGASLPAADVVVATPPAGFFKVTARANSDSLLSLPLVKSAAAMGRVTAVAAGAVTLAGVTGADGAFAPTPTGSYYLQLVSGSLAGLTYKILGNTSGVFTLATNGENLTAHPLGTIATGATGDVVCIRPYWTLGELFGTDAASLRLDATAETGGGPYLSGDAVLLFDNTLAGIDRKPASTVAYLSGTGWRKSDSATVDATGTELAPGQPFAVRRQRAAAVDVSLIGYVSPDRLLVRIPALGAGEDRDVAVALGHPVELSLANSRLVSATVLENAIENSTDASTQKDLVLEFDSSRRGLAPTAARRFHLIGGAWFEADAGAGAFTLKPGSGYLLRLRGTRAAHFWVQLSPN